MSAVPGAISERRDEIGGAPTFWREARSRGPEPPAGCIHGGPSDGDDFLPFLERTGGIAPDLPGFGRSGKQAELDYSIAGYADFLERFVDRLGLERFSLVVHDWGAVGLVLAQRAPERVERLAVLNAVPLFEGHRWPAVARACGRPLLGELAMGTTTRWGLRRSLNKAAGQGKTLPEPMVDRVWEHFDHGTQRAILKLYRSLGPGTLAEAGAGLADVRSPALVAWGVEDPWIPSEWADRYAAAVGGPVQVERMDEAGHWPWVDRPETVDLVGDFLTGGAPSRSEAGP